MAGAFSGNRSNRAPRSRQHHSREWPKPIQCASSRCRSGPSQACFRAGARRLHSAATLASQPKVRPAVTALRFLLTTGAAIVISAISIGPLATRPAAQTAAPVPYENMPEIAPPGVRIGKHIDVPNSAKGPAVDAAKGYELRRLGRNLYMVTLLIRSAREGPPSSLKHAGSSTP